MRPVPLRGTRGQASPEWLGVVLVVALTFASLAAAGVRIPGAELARTLAGKLVCVIDLGARCGEREAALTAAYGSEVAGLVAQHTPLLEYEEEMRVVPIDWRACRDNPCARAAETGRIRETSAGGAITLFSHVVDCRVPGHPEPFAADCTGEAAGNLYLQFWAYYPDSRTPPWDSDAFGNRGWHESDWESFQVRIGPDGVKERASSHHGYNGRSGDPLNDTGWVGGKSAWTRGTGRYQISAGSHAGRVGPKRPAVPTTRPAWEVHLPRRITRPGDIDVVPLESIRSEWDAYVGSEKHLPAWLKDVYLDPEATGTSG